MKAAMDPELCAASLWIDCTDVLRYAAAGNRTVSGIQRVVLNLFEKLVEDGAPVRAFFSDRSGLEWVAAENSAVFNLFRSLQAGNCTAGEIRAKCEDAQRSATCWSPGNGDTVLIAGAFWLHDPSLLLRLQQAQGLKVATFIHDVLVWRYPEYFLPVDHAIWMVSFAHILAISNIILTSSSYVEAEVAACASSLNVRCPRIGRTGMATSLPVASAQPSQVPMRGVANLEGRRFALCVGTIEARKNHDFLLDIWDRLHAEAGDAAPVLVFAGKVGWKVEAVLQRMGRLPWGQTHFVHVEAASDAELSWLYENCLFTLYPSHAEGWGLPVSESLSRGVPCLAARVASLPEAGGDWAIYCDPCDVDEGLSQVCRLLDDRFRTELRAHIAATFYPVSWLEFSRRTVAALHVAAAGRQIPEIPLGKPCFIGSGGAADPADRAAVIGGLTNGWASIEGSFAQGERTAELALHTALPDGTGVVLHCLVGLSAGGQVSVASSDGEPVRWIFDGSAGRVQSVVVKAWNGLVSLRLTADDSVQGVRLYGLACTKYMERSDEVVRGLESKKRDASIDPCDLQRALLGQPLPAVVRALAGLSARYRLTRARKAARAGDWRRAVQFYRAFLRLRPGDQPGWKQLGHGFKELGKDEEAYEAYLLSLAFGGDADSRYHVNTMREKLRQNQDDLVL